MIKLIIIGNGFDKAHDLKTGYIDFLEHLFNECKSLRNSLIKFNEYKRIERFGDPTGTRFTFNFFIENLDKFLSYDVCKIKNEFLLNLLKDISLKNWVDIEEKYFSILKIITDESIDGFNNDFDEIKKELIKFIVKVDSDFEKRNESSKISEKYIDIFKFDKPQKIWFINFNYTSTLDLYSKKLEEVHKIPSEIISIHGRVSDENSRVIFGYGDEENNEYPKLQDKGSKYLKI